MKIIFDRLSCKCSKMVTEAYSTSFALATKMLVPSIREDIYNIYGFVRFADEIVDSFHDYDKKALFDSFEKALEEAITQKISLNPILNAFQHTFHKYDIPRELVTDFMKSMRMDLSKKTYTTFAEYEKYIYGSADVVGLMCLCVFVQGNKVQYDTLKEAAMALGSAFQKINFLRDLKADREELDRHYFPHTNLRELNESSKQHIIAEIQADLRKGYEGIIQLPKEAKLGVYTAYRYYKKLLQKLQRTPHKKLKTARIRVPNYQKLGLLAHSYVTCKLQRV